MQMNITQNETIRSQQKNTTDVAHKKKLDIPLDEAVISFGELYFYGCDMTPKTYDFMTR